MSTADPGPIEAREWPTQLLAHAVSNDGEHRRLHGYDVERDLAVSYALSDTILLALTGELPDDVRSRAFAAALTFASAMSVNEAPVHASVVARLCGVRTGGVLAIAAIAVGEHVDKLLVRMAAMLESPATPLSAELRARDAAERASVERLRAAVRELDVPAFAMDPSRDVAIVAVLRACGLTTSFQIGAAFTLGVLPSVLAESAATTAGDFKAYPMDTPHFEYDPSKAPQSGIR